MRTKKTTLKKAYNRLRKLNIEMTTEEFTELSNILCDLANTQFERGLNTGSEIVTNEYNKKQNNYECQNKHLQTIRPAI